MIGVVVHRLALHALARGLGFRFALGLVLRVESRSHDFARIEFRRVLLHCAGLLLDRSKRIGGGLVTGNNGFERLDRGLAPFCGRTEFVAQVQVFDEVVDGKCVALLVSDACRERLETLLGTLTQIVPPAQHEFGCRGRRRQAREFFADQQGQGLRHG